MAQAPDGKSGQPTADQVGEKIKAMLDGAPDTMAELMRAFIANKDLNVRVKIRLRMKALLDLVAVDTAYPKVPARDMGDAVGGGFGRVRPFQPVYAEPMPPVMGDLRGEMDRRVVEGVGGGGVQPVPGADPVPQNDDVLG